MPSPPPAQEDPLYLPVAPPLDPEWLAYERSSGIADPKPAVPILERQPQYAAECRALTARMTAPGARDEHLGRGIAVTSFTVPSSVDSFAIPVLRYGREAEGKASTSTSTTEPGKEGPSTTIIYIHGGGLYVGEADSEELSIRRILSSSSIPDPTVYSIGYRLMPQNPATTSLSDCLDAFSSITSGLPTSSKVLIIGSSSGGELAALLACHNSAAGTAQIHGLALRCPVTSDAFTSLQDYVPSRFRELHTSTLHDSFVNCLLGKMVRAVPRDGLPYMPLEADPATLRGFPRTWVQVCSNDGLYSDGVCFARALEEVGVEVAVDVRWGWPHTFWLKAPELEGAVEAEGKMLEALKWLVK
jgi:acetyl esterase/lipase